MATSRPGARASPVGSEVGIAPAGGHRWGPGGEIVGTRVEESTAALVRADGQSTRGLRCRPTVLSGTHLPGMVEDRKAPREPL